MFQNSNINFVLQMAEKNYKSNKSRNIVCIIAIALTAFMILTVFSIGSSYIDTYQLQQQQLLGTTGNATLDAPNNNQIEVLNKSNIVTCVGLQSDVIQAGSVEYKGQETGLYFALRYFDSTEWEEHRKPVLENVVGTYPERENEIMIPKWVLEKMGISNPKLGDKYSFSYSLSNQKVSNDFILTGYFDEYDNSTKDGSVAYILVSDAFIEDNSESLVNMTTMADISLESKATDIQIEELRSSLNLSQEQTFSINPDFQSNVNIEISILVLFIIICIIISGYLLIYNIFNISVINNIHYFGQLKVIGITKKQIQGLLIWQGIKMSVIGIAIGGGIGYLFSSLMVPMFLNSMLESDNSIINCNIKIVLGTIIFTGITVFTAIMRPSAIAGKISPMEALRYEVVKGRKERRVRKKNKLTFFQIAITNVFKYKKRFFLVVLSMTLGITSCLTIGMLVSSMNVSNFVTSNMESDIELKNKTASLGYEGSIKQIFDDMTIEKIEKIEGITSVYTIMQQLIVPEYNSEILGKYVESLTSDSDLSDNYFSKNPELFYSQLIGVENTETLKENYPNIDWQAFDKGEICLIPCNDSELFNLGDTITYQMGNYDSSTGRAMISGVEKQTITIGGCISELYNNYGSMRTVAPYLIVSQKYLQNVVKEPVITNVMINIQEGFEKEANLSVNEVVTQSKDSSEIVTVSALEKMDGLKQVKITLYGMGGSIAVVLAMIGIINFVNVIYSGITERRRDFTIMESIGIKKKQITQMVIYESLIYFFATLIFVITIGNVLLYIIFQIFSSVVTYAEFSYPVMLLIIVFILLFLICYFVPQKTIRKSFSVAIIERLRINE